MLPVVRALRARPYFNPLVVVTGQHRHMLDQVFDAFGEVPDIDLDIMTPGQSISEVTVRILQGMRKVISDHCPDLVLVHGDTTTAMASAMAAFYAQVPIGHVEAGLRSHNMSHPWPEEFNRVVIDSVAQWLFAPTEASAENLRRESNRDRIIAVTGNTGIDALFHFAGRSGEDLPIYLSELLDSSKRLLLVTGHRRESFGGGFERICEGLAEIAGRSDVEIVYPVHLNPNVKDVVVKRMSGRANVHLIDPVDYPTMVALMKRSALILTDSGGIQEEGPALGKPVLVMRDVTERPEAVETGVVSLVGTCPDVMVREVSRLLDQPEYYASRARPVFPFGDGSASDKIADILDNSRRAH